MLRDCDLNEISDGKKYTLADMVKADCAGCAGCSACCHDMGSSIVLDPLDVCRLTRKLSCSFEALLADKIELNVVDGVILPNLKMDEQRKGSPCVFLDMDGRCSVHEDRPGICRIFPLGRVYEDGGFSYILQVHECAKTNRSKVKVSKWIDTPELAKNQRFLADWHFFLKEIHQKLQDSGDEALIRRTAMELLQYFYIEPYRADEDFYAQFDRRLAQYKKLQNIA